MAKQSRTKIASYIADTTLRDGLSSEFAKEIAAYLLNEGRAVELDSLLRDVRADWAEAGFIEVIASSAHDLDDSIRNEIKSQVKKLYPSAKKITITEEHDPEVIGGVRLKLPNCQLDLTMQAKLNRFKQLTSAGKE